MKEPKQNKNMPLWVHAVCLALVMVLTMGTTAHATEQTGSLQLNCTVERDGQMVCLTGDEFVLVQIAQAEVRSVDGTASVAYQTCPEYAAYDCVWSALTASELRAKAKLLAEEAQLQEPFSVGITDAQGLVIFEALPPGLYLVMRDKIASENTDYACEPFLVSVPLILDNVIVYEVVADPKYSWDNSEESTDPTPPPEETMPTAPSLPQTGQLNWPVPVMTAAGVLLFGAGGILRFGKRKNDEE